MFFYGFRRYFVGRKMNFPVLKHKKKNFHFLFVKLVFFFFLNFLFLINRFSLFYERTVFLILQPLDLKFLLQREVLCLY